MTETTRAIAGVESVTNTFFIQTQNLPARQEEIIFEVEDCEVDIDCP